MVVRSFLFDKYPYSLDRCKKEEIEEGYILEEPEILVRKVDDECFYVSRMGEELINEIGENAYSFFIRNVHDVTKKTRYIVPLYGEKVCNLDFYHNVDLKVASVEFDDKEESEGFYPPMWVNEEIESVKGLKRVRSF